jgi:hypothetical protein
MNIPNINTITVLIAFFGMILCAMYIDIKNKTVDCNDDVPFLKTNYAFTVTMLVIFVAIIALFIFQMVMRNKHRIPIPSMRFY